MSRKFFPGDWVRLRPIGQSPYPILARLIAQIPRECPLVVQTSTWDGIFETITVRWPDGTMSGALYAEIFYRVTDA